MKSETERLQEELNKNLFDSLIEFLQKSHSGFQKNSRDWGCQIKLREIPTAALVLDMKHFLQKLASQLMDCNVDVQSKEKESVQVTQKKIHYSMDSLSTWYMSVTQHLHEFPLILIFGIATSPVVVHRLLPHAVSSLLCIELFQSLSCKEHLTTVLDKLLLTTQFPFKLSEKVLQVLTNTFLYHDFSIQNFIKGLQNISIPSPSVFCAVISQKPREE
ncbi:hypothetical protein EI555_008670 [Monodon monoceros]|uniref:Origin recognition complex subunit 3 N-terminal domain-containing protein n=1 Tax=Monodon monoceros TaxID=40151 RepID=A0A4U1ED20_MONMO|nr:hypothetical protein EI555_008670 [Monodon monoceros]